MIPRYRKASSVKQKSRPLDALTAATGYNRKYAMELLNHTQEGQPTPQHPRPRRYGSDVQHALFLVWHAANRICAKRLIPFLPTLIEALEGKIFGGAMHPGRYRPLQIRMLQRGMRNIRADPARKPLRTGGKRK